MQLMPLLPIRLRFSRVFAAALLLTALGCRPSLPHANRVFVVQPFEGLPALDAKTLYEKLRMINPTAVLKGAIPLPANAFYKPRNRYRADSLISSLNRLGNADTVVIGLTNKDVSTQNGSITDWGVMGLGFTPGNACVISTYRLNKIRFTALFYKLALHELGHTQGLSHCPNKTCYMRDANGGNHLDEEARFCATCHASLEGKGWQLAN